MKGFVQIYTGEGKGKTTSTLGIAVRASSYGKKIFIGQFMKGIPYGENNYFKLDKNIEICQFGWENCIRKEDITQEHKNVITKGFEISKQKMLSLNYDIVILDEIIMAIWFGLIEEEKVIELIDNKPDKVELILTGRFASKKIIQKADLVTEMKCVKHYYEKSVDARPGIEF